MSDDKRYQHGSKVYKLIPQTPEQVHCGDACAGCDLNEPDDFSCMAGGDKEFDICFEQTDSVFKEVKDEQL